MGKGKDNLKSQQTNLNHLFDYLKQKDETAADLRSTLLAKIRLIQDTLKAKLDIWENHNEFNANEMIVISEWKATYTYLSQIYEDILKLDDKRISELVKMSDILINIKDERFETPDYIKEWTTY